MADDIDIANNLIANEVSRALNKIRQNNADKSPGSKVCVSCGDTIPEERRQLGFKLCVPCAEEQERKQALFAD